MPRSKTWKDALYQGTWVTVRGQVLHCGPEQLEYFHDRTKSMLAKGALIPWTWEHQRPDDDGDIGLSASDLLARWAKNTGGHIHDTRLLSPDGPLEFLIDIDDADRPKLEAIKFVSPDIRNHWRDRNGPAWDEIGPYWPGQSIAHLAVTPLPVQYPQLPFSFDLEPMSLSAAAVNVSLSAAMFIPKSKTMPTSPEKPDEAGKEPAQAAAPDPATPAPGKDLEGGGPITDPEEGAKKDAGLMQALASEMAELGIEMHSASDMDLRSFVEHLITAIKTHKATKCGQDADTQDSDTNNANTPQEPEIAESAPIMMSAATQPTDREKALQDRLNKLNVKRLKECSTDLSNRLNTLCAQGYINAEMMNEQTKKLGAIQLSATDLTDDGDLKPNEVVHFIEAFERLRKTGKPGSFARPNTKPAPGAKPNPNKPISSAVALSAAEEEVVPVPYGGDDDEQDKPVDEDVINRLSGGRYTAYKQKKNGKPE